MSWLRWWNVRRANTLFGFALKIAGILAAVAAINLLGHNPRLLTSTTCSVSVDSGQVAASYRDIGKSIPLWLRLNVRAINNASGRAATGSSVIDIGTHAACVPPGKTFVYPFTGWHNTITVENLIVPNLPIFDSNVPSTNVFSSGSFTNGRPSKSAESPDRFAQDAVTRAATVTAQVTTSNQGGGGATSVRIEPPAAFSEFQPGAPFDLSPGESHRVAFVSRGSETTAISGAAFHAFGDKQRAVNTNLLVGIGIALGFLALWAFANGDPSPPANQSDVRPPEPE